MGHNSIRKGAIGELYVIGDLLEKGYDVYTPVIDDNGVDFLVVNGDIVKKVQCKARTLHKKATSIEIDIRTIYNADVLAVPVKDYDFVCYVDIKKVSKRAFTLAYKPSLSGQKSVRNWYENFLDFPW